MNWQEALHYVNNLELPLPEKSMRWRLPTINELESLVDCSRHTPALPGGHPFENVRDVYWSSTTSYFEPDWAWALYLNKGATGVGFKREKSFHLWPVAVECRIRGRSLLSLEKGIGIGTANRTFFRRFLFVGMAAYRADVIVALLHVIQVVQGLLIQSGMLLFNFIGIFEGPGCRLVAFVFGGLDHIRVHVLEFMGFTGQGFRKIFLGGTDAAHCPQMRMGMDSLSCSRSPEKSCRLGIAITFSLFGKSEIFPVGL